MHYRILQETAAIHPESLLMLTAGSTDLQSLPLKVARLKAGAGGLVLPTLGSACDAAYIGQLEVTLKSCCSPQKKQTSL